MNDLDFLIEGFRRSAALADKLMRYYQGHRSTNSEISESRHRGERDAYIDAADQLATVLDRQTPEGTK